MKNLHYLNMCFVGMPIALYLIGLINERLFIIGLLSTILTGLFQVIIGIKMLMDEPKNIKLRAYMISVILFFVILFFFPKNTTDYKHNLLIIVPPILAIYLSVLIYKKAK